MVDKKNDIRLLVRCAQMYYEEGINQSDMAKKLGVSKATISRILNQARESGIVTINVNNPLPNEHIQLEKEIEKFYGLKEVVVVECNSKENDEIKKSIARTAAKYLSRVIKQGSLIGIAGGTTINYIPDYVENYRKNDITFVPIVGGNGQSNVDYHSNSIALKFARAYKARSKILNAPAMTDNEENKEIFINDYGIRSVLDLSKHLNIVVIGIGSPILNTNTMLLSGYYCVDDIEKLENEGAVSDVCNRFINSQGNDDKFEFNKRVIGIDLCNIKNAPLSIAIAGYKQKAEAIMGALSGGYVNVLITDYETAKEINLKK